MTLDKIAKAIEATDLSTSIRNGDWWFPSLETNHVLAIAIVFSTIVMVDLRLLGVWSRNTKVSAITRELLPWTWGAWSVAAVVGGFLFVSHAHGYVNNRDFVLKFVCMALAGVNMLVFHYGALKTVDTWDDGKPVLAAKLAGGASIVLWVGVVYFGRLIGFSGI